MGKIKKIISILGLLAIFNFVIFAASPILALAQNQAAAQTTTSRCNQFKAGFTITSTNNPSQQTSIIGDIPVYCSAAQLAVLVINYALAISGTVTMLFLIIGGFMFVTSAGNEEQSEKGRKILTNAVIGMVVIIMAAAIVRIISSTLSLS
jgi:Type IV secretion system pilin